MFSSDPGQRWHAEHIFCEDTLFPAAISKWAGGSGVDTERSRVLTARLSVQSRNKPSALLDELKLPPGLLCDGHKVLPYSPQQL